MADKGNVGRKIQRMDRLAIRQVSEGSGEQGETEKTGCKVICGALTTLAVKRLMMMMTMTMTMTVNNSESLSIRGLATMWE